MLLPRLRSDLLQRAWIVRRDLGGGLQHRQLHDAVPGDQLAGQEDVGLQPSVRGRVGLWLLAACGVVWCGVVFVCLHQHCAVLYCAVLYCAAAAIYLSAAAELRGSVLCGSVLC